MKKRPINIEVVEENDQRVVVTINADGEVKRMPVDPTRNPRASHESLTRAWSEKLDRTLAKETILIGKFDEGLNYSQALQA